MNVESLGLDIWAGEPVTGHPSWAGEFGSNAFYQAYEGGIVIYDMEGNILATIP